MSQLPLIVRTMEDEPGSIRSYIIGFSLSIALTLVAFGLAGWHLLHGGWLVVSLLGLAIVQFVFQMLFFLHIGSESKPRWKRLVLLLMIVIVIIVILGSIWIMYSLNYRMSPAEINKYMTQQDGGI